MKVACVEISPLKNTPTSPGTGADNPETSCRDLFGQHRPFLEASGVTMHEGIEIELPPLVSYADPHL